jgi:hypothetical protein
MNLSFLDDLFKGIGGGLADVDKFVDREMPFDSGWGFPAALTAAYFGAPYAMEALGSTGSAGGAAGAEGSIGSGGMNSLLSSLGLDGGSMAGQEAFQLPMQSYTPDYLNMLADYQGVDAGNASYLDRLLGNTEQGLYNQEGLAKQASGQTVTDLLKKQAQQKALSQLGQSGSKMQEQNNTQQAEQNRMAQLQAMRRGGQPVDVTTALLSLLQDREQQSKQPRISLI